MIDPFTLSREQCEQLLGWKSCAGFTTYQLQCAVNNRMVLASLGCEGIEAHEVTRLINAA